MAGLSPQASAIEVTVKRGDVSEEAAVKAFAKDFAKGRRWALPQSKIHRSSKPLFHTFSMFRVNVKCYRRPMVVLEHIGTQSFVIFSNHDRQSTFLVVYMFNKKKVIFINGWYKDV
jgi:hypothetical protein